MPLKTNCGIYNLSRASFEKEWGTKYHRPGLSDKILAFLIRIIPQIGPLRALSFRTPTPETEKLFMASFNAALDNYRGLLRDFGQGNLRLQNGNFDTGNVTPPGTYFMQDDAYARLLGDLSQDRFQNVSPALRSDQLSFFEHLHVPPPILRDKKKKVRIDWVKLSNWCAWTAWNSRFRQRANVRSSKRTPTSRSKETILTTVRKNQLRRSAKLLPMARAC